MNLFFNGRPGFPALAIALCTLAGLFASRCEASHPFHVSSAEVNWNPNSGNFEVALCVWPADLEKAIALQQKKSVDLDKVDGLDELMTEYVASRFSVRRISDPKAEPNRKTATTVDSIDLRWVGHEMDLQKAWLYFEISGDQQSGQWELENRVFFELNEDQVNHIKLTSGDKTNSFSLGKAKSKSRFSTEKTQVQLVR